MTITKQEIEKILSDVKDGNKILEYINHLEEHLEHHCDCNHEEHHHCDCGCEDDEEEYEWEEIKTEYESKLSVSDREELLKNPEIFNKDALIIMKRMRHIAAPTSSMELADTFGMGALYYSLELGKVADKIIKKLNLKVNEGYNWAVLMKGWNSTQLYNKQIYALLSELYEALGNVDLSEVPLREG